MEIHTPLTPYERACVHWIANIHASKRKLLSTTVDGKLISEKIVNILINIAYRTGGCGLEQAKSIISCESDDFADLLDLLDEIPTSCSTLLYLLFSGQLIIMTRPCTTCSIKILSDLDNTAIENFSIAIPPTVNDPSIKDKSIVKGYVDVINHLNSGNNCITFLSARPKLIERPSIIAIQQGLRDAGIRNFSFIGGSAMATSKFIGWSIYSKLSSQTHHALNAAKTLAKSKWECFLKLEKAYPLSQFIFLGDDTQGDSIFAMNLLKRKHNAMAFIRHIAPFETSISPYSKLWDDEVFPRQNIIHEPRFIAHTSYLDLLATSPLFPNNDHRYIVKRIYSTVQ